MAPFLGTHRAELSGLPVWLVCAPFLALVGHTLA